MSGEHNKALMRRWLDGFSRGDLAVMDELFAASYRSHDPMTPTQDLHGFRQFMGVMRQAFPDARATIEDQVAEEDKVTTRFTVRGTQDGPFMGLPASHKPVVFSVMDITRLENSAFVESWFIMDALGLLHQIGALPALGQETS